jgi:hypothetical protein
LNDAGEMTEAELFTLLVTRGYEAEAAC